MKLIYLLLFCVLTACGHQQNAAPDLVPDGKMVALQKNGQVLAILSSKKPLSKSEQDKLAKEDEQEREVIQKAGDVRPFGNEYPIASLDSCGDISKWDERAVTVKGKVVYVLAEMSRHKNKDCKWSQEFLSCRGILEILDSHKNLLKSQIEAAKDIYQGCQK